MLEFKDFEEKRTKFSMARSLMWSLMMSLPNGGTSKRELVFHPGVKP